MAMQESANDVKWDQDLKCYVARISWKTDSSMDDTWEKIDEYMSVRCSEFDVMLLLCSIHDVSKLKLTVPPV